MSVLSASERPETPGAAEMTVERLAALMAGDAALVVLDVREPWERDMCALPGSLSIPLAHLPALVETLPHDRTVVVVCHHGIRSAHATAWLRQAGLANAVNLAGGLDAWALRVDPKMRRY